MSPVPISNETCLISSSSIYQFRLSNRNGLSCMFRIYRKAIHSLGCDLKAKRNPIHVHYCHRLHTIFISKYLFHFFFFLFIYGFDFSLPTTNRHIYIFLTLFHLTRDRSLGMGSKWDSLPFVRSSSVVRLLVGRRRTPRSIA